MDANSIFSVIVGEDGSYVTLYEQGKDHYVVNITKIAELLPWFNALRNVLTNYREQKTEGAIDTTPKHEAMLEQVVADEQGDNYDK